MQPIQTVTELVTSLFSVYEANFKGLEWESKINEYADVINDLISFDADLDEIYKKIRQEYPYRKLPLPYDIRKILKQNQITTENKQYVSHPDNDRQRYIVCYKDGYVKDVRQYVMRAGGEAKSLSAVTDVLKRHYDDYKIYDYPKGTTYCGGTVYIPTKWDIHGNVTETRKEQIA